MRYFVAPGEDLRLDDHARRSLRGAYVALSDGTTQVEISGPERGELVALIGGLTVPLPFWDRLTSPLHARGFRTLAYSLYGRGYSDRVTATYDEALFVRQLDELLGWVRHDGPVHVLGTSMGALVAMAFAQDRPWVSSLTLISPAGLERPMLPLHRALGHDLVAGPVARWMGRRMLEGHMAREVADPALGEELAAMVRDAFRCQGTMFALFDTLQHLRLSGREELFRRTATLDIPTMLLWGDADQVTPGSKLDAAGTLLRPHTSHVIARCGHMPPIEQPAKVAEHLAAFVAAIGTESGR